MKKYLALAIVLSILVFPMISATTSTNSLNLLAKNPTTWAPILDGNCGGLDYTGDHLVNQRDENYVRTNKIDANKDGVYNSTDVSFMRHSYQNCKAGKGTLGFVSTTSGKTIQQKLKVSVQNLKPVTKYQLIYYGDSTHNDVYPYATCIGKARTTSTSGSFNGLSENFNFLSMQNDGNATKETSQKFWVILASDVDCSKGEMIVWNPTEYLFEERTI